MFGEFLREKRKAAGYSIREFSSIVGITNTYLCDIENEKRNAPNNNVVRQMARTLGLDKIGTLNLYDLAAQTKNDIPLDIKDYLLENKSEIEYIRSRISKFQQT